MRIDQCGPTRAALPDQGPGAVPVESEIHLRAAPVRNVILDGEHPGRFNSRAADSVGLVTAVLEPGRDDGGEVVKVATDEVPSPSLVPLLGGSHTAGFQLLGFPAEPIDIFLIHNPGPDRLGLGKVLLTQGLGLVEVSVTESLRLARVSVTNKPELFDMLPMEGVSLSAQLRQSRHRRVRHCCSQVVK